MKSIHKVIIAISIGVGASITSCQRLDIPPTNIFTPNVIYNSEAGVKSFLATIYQNLPIEDFKYTPSSNDGAANPAGFLHGCNDWMNSFNASGCIGEADGP